VGDKERRVLTLASVIGPEVPDALVHAVLGGGSEAALTAIGDSRLMRRGHGRHVFVHDPVRESLHDRLSVDERRALHVSVARACT
jgi:hypothetical protein